MRIERGIGIQRVVAGMPHWNRHPIDDQAQGRRRHVVAHQPDGGGAMHACDGIDLGRRRLAMIQAVADPACNQLVFDRLQAGRRFGMPGAHFMALALGMGIKGGGHGESGQRGQS